MVWLFCGFGEDFGVWVEGGVGVVEGLECLDILWCRDDLYAGFGGDGDDLSERGVDDESFGDCGGGDEVGFVVVFGGDFDA